MVTNANGVFYATTYHPIQAGSIDGTDITAHDNGVYRALLASSAGLYDPTGDPKAEGDPYCTLFVGRLSANTDERSLGEAMRRFGRVKSLRLVRHIVTGASRGYAFVTFETEKEMHQAYEGAYHLKLDGNALLVDYDRQHLMPGWIPRRLGGGLGGNKESGQLRFGGRDRPFRAPLYSIPHEELQKLGIPLPPEGRYMTRFQIPPPPQRKYGKLDDYHRNYDIDKFYDNQSSSKVGSLASGEQSVEPQQGAEPAELYTTDYRHGGFEPGSTFSKFHKDVHKSGERDRHKRRHEYSRERSDRDRHEGEGRRSKRPREESREKSLDRMEDSRYEYDRFVRENTHGGHSRDVRYLDDGEKDQQKRRKGESRHRNDRDRDTDVDNFESRSLSNKEREYTTSETRPFGVKESSDGHQHRKKIEGSADRSNHDRTKRRRETDVDEKESRSLSRMSDKELESTTSEQLKESHNEDAPDRHRRRQKRREDSEERGNISRESKRSRRHRESTISSDRERRHRHRSLKHSQRDEDGKSHHSQRSHKHRERSAEASEEEEHRKRKGRQKERHQ